jgi:hypothetical protein
VFPMLQQLMPCYVDCLPMGTDRYVMSNTVTAAPDALQLILSNGNIFDDITTATTWNHGSAMDKEADEQHLILLSFVTTATTITEDARRRHDGAELQHS